MKLINAGIELATLFQRYARKILMREGEGIMKIPSQKKVEEFAENIYQDFKSSGVPNNVIKTEKDIGRFHKQITDIEEKARKKWWDNQLKKPPELADVFDLQGNRIRDTSKIMGGQELPGEINIFSNKYLNDLDKKIIDSDAFGYSQKEWNALSNSSKEKFRKQFDSNYADAMENTQMATLKEIGSIDLPEIPKPKKADPALYEDRGGNIIPAQFKDVGKETDAQIIARIEKQNKESAERLRNKKSKDPDEPEGFYQGGQAQIEPDLSNIGHGSDALMARNMLIAPGSQATTSTGLNYLLGEDNDTTRVPYNEGNTVLPKPKPMNEYLLEQVMSQAGVNTLDPRTRQMFIEELKKKIRDENSKAEGGRVPMWLGGALAAGKSLTRELLKHMTTGSSHGKSPAEILKRVNPKQVEKFLNDPSLPFKFSSDTGIMGSDMIKDLIKQTKTDRQYVLEQLLNSARNIKKGDDNLLTYKNQIIEEMVSTGMDRKTAKDFTETLSESLLKEVGPKKGFPKVTEQGLLELENIQKNLLTKDRQLNAEGGLAGLLGESPRSVDHGPRNNYKEAGVVDKIGGMVNYKNVPHYLAKPLKGVTNIAEWVGKLPFAATELASDMIRKPLFKAGDKIPGLPGVGAKFVGGEMFEKFGDSMEVGGLSEKLGITALAENTGKNLTDEARTIGDLAELGGEFANMGGIFAAGKNLFKGSDSLKKLSQSLGKVKEGKTLEKLVDETLTANGEGRRDFNKLVASGGLMVALQSIGLGGIKAAKTKAAPDAVFTLKTIIDDSDEMTENGLMAMGRAQSFIDVSGFTDAVKKSLAVIMKNRKNQLGEKVLKNKVKGKDGKFTDDYEYIPTEEAAYIMEELQKRGHNIKFEHYDDMGGQGVDDILDKFKNNDFYKGTKLGKENYDKFSKKVAKMTDKEKFAYHSSITDDGGQYYDEFVEELLDMNFKNSTK